MQNQGILGRNYELEITETASKTEHVPGFSSVRIIGDFWPHEGSIYLGTISPADYLNKGLVLVTLSIHNVEVPQFYVNAERLTDALQFYAAMVDADSDMMREAAEWTAQQRAIQMAFTRSVINDDAISLWPTELGDSDDGTNPMHFYPGADQEIGEIDT